MSYLASGLVSLLVTLTVMPVLARLAVQWGVVDHPNARKMHVRPTPLCGGIAMACGAALPLLLWASADGHLLQCLAATLLVFVIGVYDDCYGLHFRWRLWWQTVAALLVVQTGLTIEHLPFVRSDPALGWVAMPVTILFIIGVTNAVNLLDGLDGLAGGCMLLAYLAVGVLASSMGAAPAALVAAVAIGALFGFLRYNTYKAVVFMGDAGSTLLGFVLAVTGVLFIRDGNGVVSPILLLPLIGLPIVDTAQVVVVRLVRGRSPFAADRSHLHHRLVGLGLHQREVVLVLYGLQVALSGTALMLHDAPEMVIAIAFLVQSLAAVAGIQGAAFLGWRLRPEGASDEQDAPEVAGAQAGVERRNQWLRRRRWLPAVSAALVRAAIAVFLVVGALIPGEVPPGLAVAALLAALLVLMEERGVVSVGGLAVSRLGIFAAALMACYLMAQGSLPAGSQGGWLMLGFGLGLVGLLTVAIRVTRRQIFPLSTQDGLLISMALAVLAGIFAGAVPVAFGGLVIAIAALLYGCEFVLMRDPSQLRLVQLAAIASLIIGGSRGLLS